MRKRRGWLIIALAATGFAFGSFLTCQGTTEPSDQESIEGLINGEYAAYFNDGETMGGGGEEGGAGPGDGGTATLPVGWYRALTYFQRHVTVAVTSPYTKADVYVKDDVRGTMYIDRSQNGAWDPGSKPFAVWRERYATFERANADSPWYLSAIGIANYNCQDPAKQTVNLTSVRVVSSDGFDKTYADPKTPIPLDELPDFGAGVSLTVTAVASNVSTAGWTPVSFGFMHHDLVRENMTDKGNQTYEKSYTVGTRVGVHHGGVDILDAGTLQNQTEDDYNGNAWGLPYHIK